MENYSTKDIANITDIAESTVRKYAQLLEKQGYIFNRNISGNRIFNEQDIKVFLEFKMFPKSDNSVDDIASIIATKYIARPDTNGSGVSDNTQANQPSERDMLVDLVKKVDILTDMNEKQNKFNEELLKRLEQQQKYIDSKLNERDKILLESLRQSQETQRLLAATAEEKKKPWWTKILKK
ncbi:DUF3967 domain-containing protein [Virgibacillus sp. 6R]|uniref:DUF3967 domain-containing protein n=1 Tax=Metabacillus sp. 22489 TaxID=3453928 RepID=UPI0011A182D1